MSKTKGSQSETRSAGKCYSVSHPTSPSNTQFNCRRHRRSRKLDFNTRQGCQMLETKVTARDLPLLISTIRRTREQLTWDQEA